MSENPTEPIESNPTEPIESNPTEPVNLNKQSESIVTGPELNTHITQILKPVINGILEHKESIKKSNDLIDANIQKLQDEKRIVEAEKLKSEKLVLEQKKFIEDNTVYHIKINTSLYAHNVEEYYAVFYKNINVNIVSYDSSQNETPENETPYSYNFQDAKFSRITNVEINNYIEKFDISGIITDLDTATKYKNFSEGWLNTNPKIPNIQANKPSDTLFINLDIYIKGENIYAQQPTVIFGTPVPPTVFDMLRKKYKRINKLTDTKEINYQINFERIDPSLRMLVLSKLNNYYPHVEKVEGVSAIPNLFGNIEGGKSFISYLLKPKRVKRKTSKKSKNNKRVSRKHRKSSK